MMMRRGTRRAGGRQDLMHRVEPEPPAGAQAALPAVWPEDVRLKQVGDPTIVAAFFEDASSWHPRLIAQLLELERNPDFGRRYQGCRGTKIDGIDRLDLAELQFVTARAQALFRRVLGAPKAVVDAGWANIYRRGDYCMPHSHMRATASLVYCVDPGEDDPDDPVSGRLFIADPRIASCCRPMPSYMTSPLVPTMRPGTLIIFPAQVVHGVNPYNGDRPRITLSWNIGPEEIPQSARQ
jgi:Putative 2OG-Fe(II) oxygenase